MILAVARKSIPSIMEALRALETPSKSSRVDFFLKCTANCILVYGGRGWVRKKNWKFFKLHNYHKLSKTFFRLQKEFLSAENGRIKILKPKNKPLEIRGKEFISRRSKILIYCSLEKVSSTANAAKKYAKKVQLKDFSAEGGQILIYCKMAKINTAEHYQSAHAV